MLADQISYEISYYQNIVGQHLLSISLTANFFYNVEA